MTIGEVPAHKHNRGTMNITGWFADGSGNNAGLGNDLSFTQVDGCFGKTSIGSGKTLMSTTGSYDRGRIDFNAANSWSGETSSSGGGGSHSIMQPYLAVYFFKRTA